MSVRRPLTLAVIVGLVAALGVLWPRYRIEVGYHTVEIVLDGPDWEALALREGRDPLDVLADAHRRGATSIALYEWTLRRLAEHGDASYLSGEQLLAQARSGPVGPPFGAVLSTGGVRPGTVYVTAPPETLSFLESGYAGALGAARVRRNGGVLEVRGLREDLEEMGVGFRPADLERYRGTGLLPVLRLRNYPGLTADGLQHLGTRLERVGRGYPIVFELTEVLGYDRLLPETAEVLRAAGDRYGRIEVFSVKRKQRGEERLAQEMRHEVIRLFSLTPEELQASPQPEAMDKFVRAARERNIRLLYLRPFMPTAGVVGTESNLNFVGGLATTLRRFTLSAGRAAPLPDLRAHPLLQLLLALGALAAMALTLLMLGDAIGAPVPARWIGALMAAGVLITGALLIAGPLTLWLKLLALGTAGTLPAAAAVVAVPRGAGGSPVAAGVRALWIASGVSVAAGILVAALLSQWEFMMAADVFLGVKVAQLLPLLLVALLLWRYGRPARSWRETVREIWDWSGRPLLLRYAVVVILMGLAAVILLARSGNFGLPLLSLEERARTLLEDLLVARPRTKEYLIGHPALILAGAAAAAGWRNWVMPLAAVGEVGQGGLVNSFSHIHTPLLYTVWRTVNALWLGTILGALAAVVLRAVVAWGQARARMRPHPR